MMNKRVSRSADLGCLGISLLILVVLLILLIPYLPNSLGALIPIAVIFSYYLIKVLISAAKRKIWDNRPLESADAYMERGTRKSMDNDPDAIHDFSKAIKLQPDYIIAYYYRGLAEQQFLDYKGALADFDLTLKMDPNNKWALGARGSVKNKLHDFYGAIADFSKAIEIDPKFGEIYYINRGIARSELHDYDGAITDFTKIIELDPERREAYFKRGIAKSELHDYDGAITDFTKTIELTIKLEPDIERNPRKAEVHDKARYSEFVESFFNRGILKDMLQDYKEAIIDFSKAIRYGKDYKEAYYYRGLVRKKINDFNGANEDFARVADIDPNYLLTKNKAEETKDKPLYKTDTAAEVKKSQYEVTYSQQYNRIRDNDSTGKKGRIPDFTRPDYEVNTFNRRFLIRIVVLLIALIIIAVGVFLSIKEKKGKGELLQKSKSDNITRKSLIKSVEITDTILTSDSEHVKVSGDSENVAFYISKGIDSYESQEYKEALEYFNNAIKIDPGCSEAYFWRGQVKRVFRKDLSGAITEYSMAIKLDSSLAKAYEARAWAKDDLDDFTGAINDYSKTIELDSNNSSAYYNRGLLRRLLNDPGGAISD